MKIDVPARSVDLSGVTRATHLPGAVRDCGSHYFDVDTMRFFHSRLLGVYREPAGSLVFVESRGGGGGWATIPRHAVVRRVTRSDTGTIEIRNVAPVEDGAFGLSPRRAHAIARNLGRRLP